MYYYNYYEKFDGYIPKPKTPILNTSYSYR